MSTMDIRILSLIICYTTLISGSRALFPFQGPMLYDPYASFFASNELNPFASNDMHYAIARHSHNHNHPNQATHHRHTIHKEHIHPHRHRHRHHARQTKLEDRDLNLNREQINEERDRNRQLYESELSKWRKFSPPTRTVSTSEPAVKRASKQSSAPVPKHNDDNKAVIRPKPQSQSPHSHQTINNYNQKPLNYQSINYKNSNTFRELVPKRSYGGYVEQKARPDLKKKDESGQNDPGQSSLDIDLQGDEEEEEEEDDHDHHHHHNHNHKPHSQEKNHRHKVQYAPPPKEFNKPSYQVRERTLIADNSQYKRPALYEIEAPKNLGHNRPGGGYVQKIEVPQKTLMQLAELRSPQKTSTRRPHPFEGFHTHSRSKPESEIIVNNIGTGMTRQVGASMSVGADQRNIQPKGKIFDEPINSRDRRHENKNRFAKSYSESPFRPNDRNPFNSKQFEAQSESQNRENSEERIDDPIESMDDDFVDETVGTKSENPDIFENQKKPQFKYFTEESSQPPISPLDAESGAVRKAPTEDDYDSGEGDGEWTASGGIPGEPGKDYPLLADVGYGNPESTQFSCRGRPIGFYADVSQKCQVYHQCSPQGGQRFICPNGTLFSQESLVCEWWYNVLCENSEKLYDRNQGLYTPTNNNNPGQTEDMSNDEKTNNESRDNDYSKPWNTQSYDNNPNDNNNDNYQSQSHRRHHKHHNHNHRPHSHYSGNDEYEANSNRREQTAPAPTPKMAAVATADESANIDIDLSNEESKDRFVKTLSNNQIVSNYNALNRTKNIVFLT